ncbi:MAG TPA: peptidoglycan DD-metalloendopeptidase family protein [Burkholderiales bacterium]
MKAFLALLVLVLAAGCAPQRRGAPVEDRRPPARAAAKPAAPAEKSSPAPAAPQGFYTVKRGDTLYSIALEHGQEYREVAQWNSLDDPTKISVGQVLRVAPPAAPAVAVGTPRGSGRIESRPIASAPAATEPAKSVAKEEPKLEAGPLTFAWPAKGKVVAGFAEPRQKGIDIAGKSGDPVIASAAGRVTYVGSGIPGLGKLIVIKHDQGYITVYAHNRELLVKEQQNVTRGQKIAELGEKLHFQIRKGSAAVDPILYLPRS